MTLKTDLPNPGDPIDPKDNPFHVDGGGGWNCGSGAHGKVEDYEDGDPRPGNPGVSEGEARHIQKEIAKKLREAAATRGTVPGNMLLWADEVLKPAKINWRKVLKRLVRIGVRRAYGHQRRTWRKLGRSSISTGYKFLFPATYTPRPRIGVVVDSSGSMGSGEGSPLYEAIYEVEGLCKQINADLVFLSVDAGAGEVQEISSAKEAIVTGGGGTDMRVGIEKMQSIKKNPIRLCLVLTDGETPWPEIPPKGMRIIAGLCGDHAASIDSVPDFITAIEIKDDE